MKRNHAEDITFQITIGQLSLSVPLQGKDIRVTVGIEDVSKTTCSGELSEDGRMVEWGHPFLFTASPSAIVVVGVFNLPEEVTHQWDKEPLGNQVVTNVASLLKSGQAWQCHVAGLSVTPATLSITCRACDVLTSDGHDCLSALVEYSSQLYSFGLQSRNLAFVATDIEIELARLDLCPLGHLEHTNVLNDLAVALAMQYHRDGNVAVLNHAIELLQTRLDLCPSGHPEHAKALQELAVHSWDHYLIQRNEHDLNRLIKMQEEWLGLCPLGHPSHAKALGQYTQSLWECYHIHKNREDLIRAIEMAETRLEICPEGHPEHGLALGNLAIYLNAYYKMEGNLMALNRCIDLQTQSLGLLSPDHPSYGVTLQNIALSLWHRYNDMKDPLDLNLAITLLKQVLNTHPTHHLLFAQSTHSLALMTLLSFDPSHLSSHPDQLTPSINEAFESFKLLKISGPAVSSDLLEVVQDWVQYAEKYNHSSVLEAYQTALNTLDHFITINASLDSRHESMQAGIVDLAANAFSCAIRHGDFRMAVELLEQGRGILWNQLARFDMSLASLADQDSQGQELGRKFARLSADLRKHAQGGGGEEDPYWQVQPQWQAVVEEIRRRDGFSRFLLPPQFEALQHAAECGPVIILNASQYTCDALIILRHCEPVRVPLACALADVDQLCVQLSELTRDPHAYGRNRESYTKEVLRDLWSLVVEPITFALEKDIQLPLGSRIWWCPTSKFTTLPLHAAGPYRKGQKNLMDIYVSSYAPSLSCLIRTRERVRAQRQAREGTETANTLSFAAISQARPNVGTLKLPELTEVAHEIVRIRDETGMPQHVSFETVTGDAATVDGATQALRHHRWVHVACHGAQHAQKPFESWFAMDDGKLTLMRILQQRYADAELAFLSACHTAVGDASTPDEVLHLAAGMQFAGFGGVIGTLWRVDDAVTHLIVTRFYREMFKHSTIDFEHAAAALNSAVLDTAHEVSLEKRIVFVHFGI